MYYYDLCKRTLTVALVVVVSSHVTVVVIDARVMFSACTHTHSDTTRHE